jgi:hypothetical protein
MGELETPERGEMTTKNGGKDEEKGKVMSGRTNDSPKN